ncbi:type 2 periplasmic-binding domain-containing protein [Streptomyces specialis]|uniref:transporter substrate-binding domain-containing protein n=1 Tax=Streptomyces specialis TaxID=498367 RepID=UPI00073ED047
MEIVDAGTPSDMVAGLLSHEDLSQRFDVAMPVQEVAYFGRGELENVDLIHYFDHGYSVYTWRQASQGIQSWADLCGMEIDVQNDEYAAAVEERSSEVCGSNPMEVRTGPLGDVEAVITGLPWAVNEAQDSEGEIHLSGGDLTEDLPMAMFVGDANPDLRDALLAALGALIDSGEYGDILADWGLEDGAVAAANSSAVPDLGGSPLAARERWGRRRSPARKRMFSTSAASTPDRKAP